MAGITTSGSIIDVQSIVSQLMGIERMPIGKLDSKISLTQAKITAYSTLKSKFSALESAAFALSLKSSVNAAAYATSSSDESVMKVALSGASASAVNSVTVNALAQNHTIATKEFASATTGVVTGDFDITVAGVTKTISVNNASLNDMASAINNSGADVRASVVYGTSGYRLVMSSKTSGASNAMAMQLSATQSNTPSGDADFTFGGTGTMIQTVAAQDAQLVVDGLTVTRSTNVISDVVPGATLSLQKTSATPVTVTISQDTSGLKGKLTKLVEAYNDLLSYTKSKAPTGTDSKGDLKGEMSVVGMMANIRSAITGSYGPAGMEQLSSVGVRFQKDGTLALDSAVFDKAVAANYDGVMTMLAVGANGQPGAMKAISTEIKGILATDGELGSRTAGLDNSVRKMKARRSEMDAKLESVERRLLNQYSRLDASLAKMQAALSGAQSLFAQPSK